MVLMFGTAYAQIKVMPILVAPVASATTVYNIDQFSGAPDVGWEGFTFVDTIGSANLLAASGSKATITIYLVCPAGSTVVAYFGQQGGANQFSFTGTQVQLKWGGLNTLTCDGVATSWDSDVVTLGESYDNTKNYITAAQFTGGPNITTKYVANAGDNGWYKSGANAATTAKSGYSVNRTDVSEMVTKIVISN